MILLTSIPLKQDNSIYHKRNACRTTRQPKCIKTVIEGQEADVLNRISPEIDFDEPIASLLLLNVGALYVLCNTLRYYF